MPRISIDLTEGLSDQLEIYMKENGIKTKTGAIRMALNSALIQRENGADSARFPHARARLASLDKENIITERAKPLESSFSLEDSKNTRKSAPPELHHLPADWEPPHGFQSNFCAKYGLNYKIALELFCSQARAEGRRSKSWDDTWRAQVVRGQLRHVKPDQSDEMTPEQTPGYWLNYRKDD